MTHLLIFSLNDLLAGLWKTKSFFKENLFKCALELLDYRKYFFKVQYSVKLHMVDVRPDKNPNFLTDDFY